MATGSEVDWSACVQSLIAASCSSFKSNNLPELLNALTRCESDILQHEPESECFYSAFGALATHYVCQNVKAFGNGNMSDATAACKVLLKYLLDRLKHQHDECTINKKTLMVLIGSLCKGSSSLPKSDVVTFTALLKAAKPPPNIRSKETEEVTEPKDVKRPRLDTGTNIFDQLTSVFHELPSTGKQDSPIDMISSDGESGTLPEANEEAKTVFSNKNIQTLQILDGANVLLDVCLQLIYIKRYKNRYLDTLRGEEFTMPNAIGDAVAIRNSFHLLLTDISVVWKAFSLPILEPLTPQRLEKVITVAMTCLYTAITVTTATSMVAMAAGMQVKGVPVTKDQDELDAHATGIVQKSLAVFNSVCQAVRSSTKAGGHALQNLHLLGSWFLMMGLQNLMNWSPQLVVEKGVGLKAKPKEAPKDTTSTSSKSGSPKSYPGFGVLGVALASKAIGLLSALLEDVNVESLVSMNTPPSTPESAGLNIEGQYKAAQRVHRLISDVPLANMLFSMLTVAFKKATSIKKQKSGQEPTDTSCSSSDSNTYYEDDFSSSEDSSDEDEDSEPLFGQWFEETLSPGEKLIMVPSPSPPTVPEAETKPEPTEKAGSEGPQIVPDKKEPDGYISLATDILQLMNTQILGSPDTTARDYISQSLNAQHMAGLADVIKGLDKECSCGEQAKLYEEFSSALSRFSHSIIATELLSESMQDCLLAELGLDPLAEDPWPMTVQPRTLSVLCSILLQRQQKERQSELVRSKSEAAIVNIWTRFLTTLKASVFVLTLEIHNLENVEDVNVEHLQLLLLLFHSLPLLQKKTLLLQLSQQITSITEQLCADESPDSYQTPLLPVTRMALVLDYLLHNFYDPPAALMDQVQWNLYGCFVAGSAARGLSDNIFKTHFPCNEVEENYRKSQKINQLNKAEADQTLNTTFILNGNQDSMKPRFYNLSPSDYSSQDVPKVDGLACSFLLGNPDVLSYNSLYHACISLLLMGSRLDLGHRCSALEACALHYHFHVTWRLLACLPPSTQYLMTLESGTVPNKPAMVMHTLRWASRLGHKAFSVWAKDCLVRQGMTTQDASFLVTRVSTVTNTVLFDVKLVLNYIQGEISVMPLAARGDIIPQYSLPTMFTVMMLDAVVAKVQVALDDLFTKSMVDTDPHKAMSIATDFLPATFLLIEEYMLYIKSFLLNKITSPSAGEDQQEYTKSALQAYSTVISISSAHASKVSVLGMAVSSWLPGPVRTALEKWGSNTATEFPSVSAYRNAYANDIIPSESYIDAILTAHMGSLSSSLDLTAGLKHLMHALVRFSSDLIIWCPDDGSSKELVRVLFPLMYDSTTEYIADNVCLTLEKFLGSVDSDTFITKMYQHVISKCHHLLINHSDPDSGLDERILHDCLKFLETHLDKPQAKTALERFYKDRADLVNVLLSTGNEHLGPVYGTKVLKFFEKLLQLAEKSPGDKSYETLCASLGHLAQVERDRLMKWLSKMVLAPLECTDDTSTLQENRRLLQSLTSYLVKDNSHIDEEVAKVILKALILLAVGECGGTGFPELMVVMQTLASAGAGEGYLMLLWAATDWLQDCKKQIKEAGLTEKFHEKVSSGQHQPLVESVCCLLSYISDILGAVRVSSDSKCGLASPPYDGEVTAQDGDSDWAEEVGPEEEESDGEDSDEESLNNKLCTFTVTQKEFMNQHWYHCHTCKMVDGMGVCNVCAKVCHKDHELSYAKYGSFFCDCGAKEDGSCQALVKRTGSSGMDSSGPASGASPFSGDVTLPSSLRRRLSSPTQLDSGEVTKSSSKLAKAREAICRQIEGYKSNIVIHMQESGVVNIVLELLTSVMPSVVENYQCTSSVGSRKRALKALQDLHTLDKRCETSDQLMTATLGSQEGAFENVKMNYSGDQGQTIRQLIQSHVLRRVAMCCMTSPTGKRQHLAVSHEKGKITILQLSALLKQADSSKRKLTLTRLTSAPVPFTVLSMAGNPCNEDVLAVCGLKECHVLTFSSSGSVGDHIVLHPSLETGNFIIKAVWLPGSQTELAIVTANFVKVYDLSEDVISPVFYYLLPSGKIRDTTFMFTEEGRHLLVMSSTGYIYTQQMDEESSAQHGPFYITNILEIDHPDIKEANGQVAGGGVSVYYSHALQLLFLSYSQGKSFVAPVPKDLQQLTKLFSLTWKTNGGKAGHQQPLVQWMEVANHPGLVCSMTQTSNNPVIIMLDPCTFVVQEIKVMPAKAKIQDMVALRHTGSSAEQHRTTLILLCEDGSLRIYMANVDNTGYWMSPLLQPQSILSSLKPARKKKTTKSSRSRQPEALTFPIDFFENCQQTNDLEFGGNDVLQVYNTAQVKHRLNTNGMYIASTKQAGFSLDIMNTNNSNVMVGVRVLVGSQAVERAPSYLEVFGRTTQVNTLRSRWYDLPFTREESLTSDKKFTLFLGASVDPAGVTMVDSIKVYVKTKEAFGWPEETEDFPDPAAPGPKPVPVGLSSNNNDTEGQYIPSVPLSLVDHLLSSSLEVLDCAAVVLGTGDEKDTSRQTALDLATRLLTLPTPASVQQPTRALLSSLFTNRGAYYNHRDQALLSNVVQLLQQCQETQEDADTGCDPEAFQRLVVTARSVAVARPANLVRFIEKDSTLVAEPKSPEMEVTDLEGDEAARSSPEEPASVMPYLLQLEESETQHFMVQLLQAFWKLHASRPKNISVAPPCLPGLTHIEATVAAMVEIIHGYAASDLDNVALASKLYVKLLLCEDPSVSFACKQALIRVLRPKQRKKRVFIPSPPHCSTPEGRDGEDEEEDTEHKVPDSIPPPADEPLVQQPPIEEPGEQYEIVDPPESMVLGPPVVNAPPPQPSPLEALLDGGGNFPPLLDIPPDADDEAMVELAIALSLQDQAGQGSGLNLQGLQLGIQGQGPSSLGEGHLSDTTASAPGSDDEVGSTAATDGSTLRTSPAEHGGSAGSESGGSAIESISGDHNVSGRSSLYGDGAAESATTGARSETSSVGAPSGSILPEGEVHEPETQAEIDSGVRLHTLRLLMLDHMLKYLPEIHVVGGVGAIPFMQVLLMLSSDLDSEEEKDKAALTSLLTALMAEIKLPQQDVGSIDCRTARHEVILVTMRLLSVLMSRTKAGTKPSTETSSFVSTHTAGAMLENNVIELCLEILKTLLKYWKTLPEEEEGTVVGGQLLKPQPTSSPPDMSPFFLRQYVKGHASDVFEAYPQLLTEMVLRLPYQMKKIADSAPHLTSPVFDQAWHHILCEYMLTPPQTPFVKRQVRKLLLFISGSKEHYRQTRDMHSLETHMGQIRELCKKEGFNMTTESAAPVLIPYDTLINLMEHLKACSEIATSRVVNWQSFCQKDDTVLPFLVTASISLDEGVAPVLLQLLQCALCGVKALSQQGSSSSSPSKKKNKDKDKEEASESDDTQKHDEALCQTLVQQVSKFVTRELLIKFIRAFLLESNSTAVRWQAHALILHIYRCSPSAQQDDLLVLMWALWCELPAYGRKGAQFVDLLGYFALKASACLKKRPNLVHVLKPYVEKAVAVLRRQNNMLANHPNASIYNALQGLVEVDGYFLESDPCLVCNNPEVPYTNIKLSAIKVDSKFTTTTQIVKLFGSYNISKIAIRISDLKRTKMVRTINIYYNNRAVQAVVELKNRPGIWHKAKKVTLTAGQTDIKVEFPLPIVACNLMIEYADFYDNLQGTTETLQCPRCSASVPANPGVCGNCGENVFQCHKCRSINYDEKDPFLCNACGFCKYAKFDFSLTARPCSAVDPIENDEDRKKAVSTINSLLEKADKLYRQVQVLRPGLEGLLFGEPTLCAGGTENAGTTTTTTTPSGTNANANTSPQVKKTIYQIAQKYQDCRTTYEELSKVIQRVLASRKELVEYDRQQKEAVLAAAVGGSSNPTTPVVSPRGGAEHPLSRAREVPSCDTTIRERTTHCYGCATATVELCVTLLRALATDNEMRAIFCSQGLIPELVRHNLCSGTQGVRQDVKQLLCVLTKDSVPATDELNNILLTRIKAVMTGQVATADVAAAVKNEIGLLAATIEMDDSLWERRIRCVLQLFLVSMELRNPVIMENITLPCLRILHRLINPEPPTSKKYKEKTIDALTSVSTTQSEVHCDVQAWLRGDPGTSFTEWQRKMAPKAMEFITKKKKDEKTKDRDIERRMARIKYLMEKYGQRWRNKIKKADEVALSLVSNSWLKQALFSPSSKSARQTACQIIEAMCQVQSRKKIIIDMLTGYLDELGKSGECAGEFLALYKKLISPGHWIFYLAVKGILPRIASLITKEIENLTSLEETTLSSDLTQGFALKALTELMSTLVEQEEIKQHYKNRLVGSVLGGYLSLRKLVVQRTKLIDDTQEKLLELLEQMTTGTESETKEFMSVCVETVNKYPMDDFRSPAFIFERLCSIIYPEENDVGEFFMILEKDPQQEDFLQGRMLGNPYSSSEPGLGPLMRDVKNKICQDCELIALLEDDTGMELLVNNKIISLDLPVKDVYKKVWLADHNEGEPMRVVYRMRGLLGDATEDMVNSLDSGKDDDVDEEEVYRMAGVLAQCGGLNAMLNRLSAVHELVTGKQLMQVLLKLFSYCVKVKVNRDELIKPAMNSISIMLGALNLALLAEQEAGVSTKGQTMTEQILQIMETVLQEASSSLPPEQYKRFSDLCGDHEQLMMLLDRINSPFVRANAGVLQALMRLIPFLAFGDQEKMAALVNHFKPYCNFNKYDFEHNEDEQIHIDCFCAIAQSIEKDANGVILKDMIQEQGIVKEAVEYIQMHAPEVKTLLATDSEDWKELISKPALPFSLRLLTGLSRGHPKIQVAIGQDCIRILHKLEQVSSDEHIGSLAENLMESLRENPEVAAKIEEIRHQTKAEKKKLAMAMRQKQLGALGMKTNEKGQVTVKSSLMKQVEDLKEETGVTCCICREGYRCQPNKVLGIYTFTKRVNLEDFELKQRKTQGYCTVTHFNTIHVDCHLAAVRHARGREEWTSAELQNTNTKCNGLLPLWGPEVPESAFASCLARHNTYLQEATGVRDTTYSYTIHDLKHLLLRFAQEKSFSADSGGGGRQSNMYIIPYVMHMALYVLNTTRSVAREEKNLNNFLKASPDKWVENAYEVEGVLYWLVIGLHILGRDGWKEKRLDFLKRLVATAHIRAVSPGGAQSLKEKEAREYSSYKSYLVFFGLVDGMFNMLYKKVTSGVGETWAGNLAEYIRSNDQQMQEAGDKLLASLEEEMLPCESFSEYCDVMGFLEQIPNPDSFLHDLFASIP